MLLLLLTTTMMVVVVRQWRVVAAAVDVALAAVAVVALGVPKLKNSLFYFVEKKK
jgi:hypothetical protein